MIAEAAPNLLSTVLSAVAAMGLGFLWYSPMLFGNQWMKLMGITKKDMSAAKKKGMQNVYMMSTVGALLTAYVFGSLLNLTGVLTVMDALKLAFFTWLGIVAPVQMTEVLFGGKTKDLFMINTGYQLASLLLMAIVFSVLGY